MLGTSRVDQYSLVEVARQKWQENENVLHDNEYELPILKYDAKQETLVK
jgi:hypothetical protein